MVNDKSEVVGVKNRFNFRMWDINTKRFYYMYLDELIGLTRTISIPKEATIQQYTGLNDKNKIEVYEGDIVKINRCYIRPFVSEKLQIDYKLIDNGEVEVGQILWGWNIQKYIVSYEHIRYDDVEDFDKPSHRVEVIGNIFETPELLK
jgi:uncharacterized phage protein (TIGR01671 family)